MMYHRWQAFFFALILLSSISATQLTFAQVAPVAIFQAPKKQVEQGASIDQIRCNEGLVLMKKLTDDSPACVKSLTSQKLVQHGWGVILSQENPPTSSKGLADTSNTFGLNLFSNLLQKDQGNVFFSPYSISSAFSMLYEGAHGNTRDEIQSVFHFEENDDTRRESVKAIDSQLDNPNEKYKLDIANALWVQNEFPVLKDYTDTLEKYYSAKATNLDFKTKPEDSRQVINNWVENKTNQKIKDLFPPGSINESTRAVLANAIYFKGNWTNQFNENLTKDDDFKITDQQTVTVPTMTTQSNFKYLSDKDLQALELPYQGGNLSMIVLLPKENNLRSLTESLSVEKLNQWKSKLAPEEVIVYMPKFTLNTKYILNDNLASMGMPSAFLPDKADFSGITGNKDLSVSIVVHQAFVQVDEKGTEAAAATGVGMQTTSIHPPPEIFRADHPFVFFIYDNQTGLILFMGQVVDPSAK